MSWRVGRKLGRTLYYGDILHGMLDTPAIAQRIADAMNAAEGQPLTDLLRAARALRAAAVATPPGHVHLVGGHYVRDSEIASLCRALDSLEGSMSGSEPKPSDSGESLT